MRLFVVDDHPAVLAALTAALTAQPGLRVVGTAASAEAAYAALAEPALRVDVAIVDVRLPGATGVELCRRLAETRPDVRCVLLSASEDAGTGRRALAAGAAAYLVKDLSTDELVAALWSAARGERFADRRVARTVPRGRGVAGLSPGERHVLRLVADGLTDAEIAAATGSAPPAAAARVARLLLKLGARTRAEAAMVALRDVR